MDTASHTQASMSSHADNPAKMKEHAALMDLVPKSQVTHTAIRNGSWFDPNVWQGGVVPGNGAHVMVDEGVSLRYDQESETRLKTVRLDGTLTFVSNRDTKMVVDTFVSTEAGTLNIGSLSTPVQADKTAQIIIADEGLIDRNWDPTLVSRGLITHGKVRIYGAEKTDFSRMREVEAGSRELVLIGSPQGWRVGDKLVVGGTAFDKNGSHSDNSRFQDETLTITSVNGNRVRFTNDDITTGDNTVLRFDHIRPDIPEKDQLNLYVANTSRNVIVETENSKSVPTQQRGHVMFMHNPDVVVQNAGFYNLGRTDKTRLVDDPGKNMDGSSGSGTNRRARYPLHFHRNGSGDIDGSPAIARGNAVVGSPGWGIVHHDSHAILEDNVVFDVAGAGIVAESGNEIGAWRNNLTIKMTGTGYHVLSQEVTRREGKFDLGFQGEGFWMQGAGQVAMKDNVAISANEAGVAVFGDSLRPADPREAEKIAVKNLPADIQKLFPAGATHVDITDVPLRQLTGFESYNSGTGISVWGHLSNFDGQLALDARGPNATHGGRSTIDNFKVWNSHSTGIRTDYSSSIDYVDGLIIGNASKPVQGYGIVQNQATRKNHYQNLTVRGFREGADFSFPGYGKEKNFTAPSVENSRFGNNTYNLTRIGNDRKIAGRPDDFSGLLKIQNTVFENANGNGNAAPVAAFSERLVGGLSVAFDGSDSMDSDPLKPDRKQPLYELESKGIAHYAWDFDQDGKFDAYGRKVTHHFSEAGNQTVTLQVLDNQGAATTLTKTVAVKRIAYTNPFINGDFSQSSLPQARLVNSTSADKGWMASAGVRLNDNAVILSNGRDKSSAVAQVIQNDQLHKGQQTLSFSLKNQEGSSIARSRNKITVQLWGIDGQFENNIENSKGPIQAGTLPIAATKLVEKKFDAESFDWKNFSESADLGNGYQHLLFQVNTEDTSDRGDVVAIDNVSLTAGASAPISNPTLISNPTPIPDPMPALAESIRFEAENMRFSGEYQVESVKVASGGKVASLRGGKVKGTGRAAFDFTGQTGNYDIKIIYFDENDGVGQLSLFKGSTSIDSFELSKQLGSASADEKTLTQRTIQNVSVQSGDAFSFLGVEDGTVATAEHARIDAVEFIARDTSSSAGSSASSNPLLEMTGNFVSVQGGNSVLGKQDILTGGQGADAFILGTSDQIFYSDGQADTAGLADYALIKNFQPTQGDVVQLSGISDYQLGASPVGMPTGVGVFATSGQTDELLAIVTGDVDNLQINSNAFAIV